MLLGALAYADAGNAPVPVRSQVFDIAYAVNSKAEPLSSVRLWYTLDHGTTWQFFGEDGDRQSPLTFRASVEGLHGFFLVLSNATGPSSTDPSSGTEPQRWAYVDYTPPLVQMQPPRITLALGRRVIQIRWTAIDANFGTRPVEITYRRLPARQWNSISIDPVANTGRYDWRPANDITGPVAVRMTVQDRGGNRVTSEQQIVEIPPWRAKPNPISPVAPSSATTNLPTRSPAPRGNMPSRAQRLFAEAIVYRDRGQYREGIASLREAVALKPTWTEAFAEMADMLYRIGDLDRSLSAYDLALRQDPQMRAALRGAAMVHRRRNDNISAAAMLRTILRYNPNDAEVWMNLGDLAIYQGDESQAREYYTRATQIDPYATLVIDDSRKRLALMAEASRTFGSIRP